MNAVSAGDLLHKRLKAAWREDPSIAISWGQAQASTHRLRQQLRERGWDESELAAATQELMRSIIAQIQNES